MITNSALTESAARSTAAEKLSLSNVPPETSGAGMKNSSSHLSPHMTALSGVTLPATTSDISYMTLSSQPRMRSSERFEKSQSMMRVRCPSNASDAARLAATVDLPMPPLQEVTIYVCRPQALIFAALPFSTEVIGSIIPHKTGACQLHFHFFYIRKAKRVGRNKSKRVGRLRRSALFDLLIR